MNEKQRRRELKRQYLESDPAYRELHREPQALPPSALAAASADEVEDLIVQEVLRRLGPTPESELAALKALPPMVSALFATWLLESEVMNGGFEQFFFNQQEAVWHMAVRGYREFGIHEAAEVATSAMEGSNTEEWLPQERYFDESWAENRRRKAEIIKSSPEWFALGA